MENSEKSACDLAAKHIASLTELLQRHYLQTTEGSASSDSVLETDNWLLDHGQIAGMKLPQYWLKGTAFSGSIGNNSYSEYHPAAAPDVKLVFYFRGYRVSEQDAAAFRSLLDMPPHLLQTNEVASLGEVLRDKKREDGFVVFLSKTIELNGRRVIVIEGRFRNIQQDIRTILVDADGWGRTVQEIIYLAPKGSYLTYLEEADKAIASIRWK